MIQLGTDSSGSPGRRALHHALVGLLALALALSAAGLAAPSAGAQQWAPPGDKDTGGAPAEAADHALTIDSAGPLETIAVGADLHCDVTRDGLGVYFADHACGTFVATGGDLFGPEVPAGPPTTTYSEVSQSAVSGSGSAGDPFEIATVVTAGTLELTQVDSYVVGEESYETAVTVENQGADAAEAVLYRAADCMIAGDDASFGARDDTSGAVACVQAMWDGDTAQEAPGDGRVEFDPLTAGSTNFEGWYFEVWEYLQLGDAFPDDCDCDEYLDSGMGVSWQLSLAPGESVTHRHATRVTELAGPMDEACPAGVVPAAPFDDIAGNVHAGLISCAAWHGVARGTTATTYSPTLPVRRDQLASFVVRLIERAVGELPEFHDQGFEDIAGNAHAGSINQLAELGVVLGTSPTTYSPRALMRRDQMATVLVNTAELFEAPLPAASTPFGDIAGTTHEGNIQRAYGAGLVLGTSATTYSPARDVGRDQTASFLMRVLDRLAEDGWVGPIL